MLFLKNVLPSSGPIAYLGTGEAIEVASGEISWRAALLGHCWGALVAAGG